MYKSGLKIFCAVLPNNLHLAKPLPSRRSKSIFHNFCCCVRALLQHAMSMRFRSSYKPMSVSLEADEPSIGTFIVKHIFYGPVRIRLTSSKCTLRIGQIRFAPLFSMKQLCECGCVTLPQNEAITHLHRHMHTMPDTRCWSGGRGILFRILAVSNAKNYGVRFGKEFFFVFSSSFAYYFALMEIDFSK